MPRRRSSTPLLPPQNFLVRVLHNLCYSFGSGFNPANPIFSIIRTVFMHLALMPMKVEFVDARRAHLKSLDVASLIFHDSSHVASVSILLSHGFLAGVSSGFGMLSL